MRFIQYRFWSIYNDAEMARLSLFDTHGSEYWQAIPYQAGKNWRKRRDTALTAIADAMDDGATPGEVTCAPD